MDEATDLGSATVKNFVSVLSGKLVGAAIAAILLIAVARLLGPSGYGIYTLAFGVSALVGAAGHFGIGTYFNNYLARYKSLNDYESIAKTISSGYVILFPIALAVSALGIGISGIAASFYSHTGISIYDIEIAVGSVFFSMVYGASYSGLIGLGRGRHAAISNISTFAVQLVASVSLILAGFGVAGAIAGILIGYAFGFAISFYYVLREIKGKAGLRFANISDIKSVVRFSMPLAANNALSFATGYIAILLLGTFSTAYILGNYGVANKGYNMIAIFTGSAWSIMMPMLSARRAQSRDAKAVANTFSKALLYTIAFVVPFIVYIGVMAKPIIFLLITRSFGVAPLYLLLVVFGVIISLPGLYATSFIIAYEKVYKLMRFTALSAAVQIISLFILVPHYGAVGAIISLFYIGSIFNDIIFYHAAKSILKEISMPRKALILMASVAIIAPIMAIALVLPHAILQAVAGAAILLAAYPFILILLSIINKEFVKDMGRFSSKIPFIRPFYDIELKYIRFLARLLGKEDILG
ncbi:MAG: oligosaccharide flippase family protein [Candidatus Micrarchaeaceae archaeon]